MINANSRDQISEQLILVLLISLKEMKMLSKMLQQLLDLSPSLLMPVTSPSSSTTLAFTTSQNATANSWIMVFWLLVMEPWKEKITGLSRIGTFTLKFMLSYISGCKQLYY